MTPEQIGNRINNRRKALDLTLQDIADRVGVARSTIQRYEAGTISQMKMPVLYAIAQALDVNPDWLVGKSADMKPPAPPTPMYDITAREYSLVRSYRKTSPADRQIIDNIIARYPVSGADPVEPAVKVVPLFGTAAAAGPGEMDTGETWTDYEVPADSRAEFAVRVSGDSMEPELHDGQIALCVKRRPEIGDVTVVMVNGAMLVKQFITDGRNIYLRSLNRARRDADVDIRATGNDTVRCFGTVLLPRRPALVDEWP